VTKLCSEKMDDKFGEHWRENLKANKFQNVDQMRIKSLGKDDKGNTYWRFTDDCWIFKEGPRKSRPKPINGCKPYLSHVTNQSASTSTSRQHSKSDLKSKRNSDEDWEVVCTTFEEFEDWVNQLKKCRSREQKVLFQFLKETLLPELKAQEQSSKRRSERNKFVASVVPKRSSRIQDAIARKEEEKKKRDEEEKTREEEEARKIEENLEQERMKKEQEREQFVEIQRELQGQEMAIKIAIAEEKKEARQMRLAKRNITKEVDESDSNESESENSKEKAKKPSQIRRSQRRVKPKQQFEVETTTRKNRQRKNKSRRNSKLIKKEAEDRSASDGDNNIG